MSHIDVRLKVNTSTQCWTHSQATVAVPVKARANVLHVTDGAGAVIYDRDAEDEELLMAAAWLLLAAKGRA